MAPTVSTALLTKSRVKFELIVVLKSTCTPGQSLDYDKIKCTEFGHDLSKNVTLGQKVSGNTLAYLSSDEEKPFVDCFISQEMFS